MNARALVPVLMAAVMPVFAGCDRAPAVTAAKESGVAARPPEPIARGVWASGRQGDGAEFQFSVREFGVYSTIFDELKGRAAVLIDLRTTNSGSTCELTKESVEATLLDGSKAGVKAFRLFDFDSAVHTASSRARIPDKPASLTEMVDGTSRIGSHATDRYLTYPLSDEVVFEFGTKETKPLAVGLILDAPFESVKTLRVFGHELK